MLNSVTNTKFFPCIEYIQQPWAYHCPNSAAQSSLTDQTNFCCEWQWNHICSESATADRKAHEKHGFLQKEPPFLFIPVALKESISSRNICISCQHLESGGFASTIHTQESKALQRLKRPDQHMHAPFISHTFLVLLHENRRSHGQSSWQWWEIPWQGAWAGQSRIWYVCVGFPVSLRRASHLEQCFTKYMQTMTWKSYLARWNSDADPIHGRLSFHSVYLEWRTEICS